MTSPSTARRRLRPAGAGAGHRDLGDLRRLDGDGVERAADRGERVAGIQERRVDAHREAAVDPLGGPDQLEAETEIAGVLEVVGLDLLDPLVADLIEVDRRVEREPGEDRHLGGGVATVDVLGRVGLGVPEPLGVGERLIERHAGPSHLGEDEVRRAVDDSVDPVDRRAGQRLLDDADDRDDARHRALEAQLDAIDPRGLPQLLAVLREQLLVRGHDVLAGLQRAEHVFARGVDPADQLDDQIGLGEDVVERAASIGSGRRRSTAVVPWHARCGRRARAAARRTSRPPCPRPSRPIRKPPSAALTGAPTPRGRHRAPSSPRSARGEPPRGPRRPGRR